MCILSCAPHAQVDSILVELGDSELGFAACERREVRSLTRLGGYACRQYDARRPSARGPRHGDADDLWALMHELGYRYVDGVFEHAPLACAHTCIRLTHACSR